MTKDYVIEIQISVGELLDRLSILQLKIDNARRQKLNELDKSLTAEAATLRDSLARLVGTTDGTVNTVVISTFGALTEINRLLWDIEDKLRQIPYWADDMTTFAATAALVPMLNDRRAELKVHVNKYLGSSLSEAKIYSSNTIS